jgi:hypothetical protein
MGIDPEAVAWEARALADLAQSPRVYCYPGFMGSVCERLVAKGLATRRPAGFLDPPSGMTPAQLRKWGWRAEDHAQFRYSRSELGA